MQNRILGNAHIHAFQFLHYPMTMAILTKINFHGKYSGCSLLFLIRQTITLFYVILLPVFINTLHGQICNAQPQYMCNGNNYTKGSNFERNLNTVLNSLVQRASQTGFNTSVYGQIPDQIYGLLQCSGNATAQQCYNCSQKSVPTLRQVCGSVIGGRVWLEDCYLRYENGSFFGQLDYSAKYEAIPQNVSSPDIFNAALEKLLNELAGEATSGSGYASGTVEDSSSRNIYGMAQCWKDITSDDCTKCLLSTINNIVTLYNGSQGVDAFIGSCRVRYELYSFFHSIAETPAITVAISPPSSNNTQTNRRSGRASNKMPIILSAVGGLLLVLFVCLFGCRRRLKSAIFRRRREGLQNYGTTIVGGLQKYGNASDSQHFSPITMAKWSSSSGPQLRAKRKSTSSLIDTMTSGKDKAGPFPLLQLTSKSIRGILHNVAKCCWSDSPYFPNRLNWGRESVGSGVVKVGKEFVLALALRKSGPAQPHLNP